MNTETDGVSPDMCGTSTQCASCDSPLSSELTHLDNSDQRKPCPQCGSLARKFNVECHSSVHVTSSVEAHVITYPQALLDTCCGLLEGGQYGVAVIVAHMACEIATERALSDEFVAKGLPQIEEAVVGLMNGYSLGNDKHRKLYNALSGKRIEEQPFWPDFKASAERRNKVIHKGAIVTQADARLSYEAACKFVAYLKQ